MRTETTANLAVEPGESFVNAIAFTINPVLLNRLLQRGCRFVVTDVRDPEVYANGHVPGATNLPRGRWSTLQGLNPNGVNVVYSDSAVRHLADAAAIEFADRGFFVLELEGGFEAWQEHRLPVEK